MSISMHAPATITEPNSGFARTHCPRFTSKAGGFFEPAKTVLLTSQFPEQGGLGHEREMKGAVARRTARVKPPPHSSRIVQVLLIIQGFAYDSIR